jgi:hypothetical protein
MAGITQIYQWLILILNQRKFLIINEFHKKPAVLKFTRRDKLAIDEGSYNRQ